MIDAATLFESISSFGPWILIAIFLLIALIAVIHAIVFTFHWIKYNVDSKALLTLSLLLYFPIIGGLLLIMLLSLMSYLL